VKVTCGATTPAEAAPAGNTGFLDLAEATRSLSPGSTPMSEPTPPAEVVHPVEYDRFTGSVTNPDFKGAGQLTIRPDRPTYIFSGKPRGLLTPKSARLVFGPDDITDVVVDGRVIQFTTHLGQAGRKNVPFGFYCRDEAGAQTVASLLPKREGRAFAESRDFVAKLDAVAGPERRWLSVTNGIIALNVVVFALMGALGAGWIQVSSMTPYIRYGANNGAATTDGEWWRLLASMFMHYGLLHLLFNLWALFQAGRFLERLQGRALYAVTYLGSGLAGGLASIGWHGDRTWSAGASGAVFGVYAAILGHMLREKQALPAGVFQSMLKSSLVFAGYNIVYGLARTGIDNAAHLGGAAGGLVFGWLLALPLDREIRAQQGRRRLALGLATTGLLCALGVALTPRYDYRISDLILWQQANRPFRSVELRLIEENEAALQKLARGQPDPDYPDWVDRTLIPFYENWTQALAGLELAPDKATIRLRTDTLAIFRERTASYRRLVAGLRANDRNAARVFFEENVKISRAIQKLQADHRR
jgi:rhomboid protease GluP